MFGWEKNSNQDSKFSIYKLGQNEPINDKAITPHPASPKLFSTLCFKAGQIALVLSIKVASPMAHFPKVEFPSWSFVQWG